MHKIVLTGGPCAGKTSALAEIKRHFTELGFLVLVAPETATNLFHSGLSPEVLGGFTFQTSIIDIQRSTEDCFEAAVPHGQKAIIIFDRGLADGRAYASPDVWTGLMKTKKLDLAEIFERYDAVLHLTSIACTHPEFYTTANNVARRENCEEAALADNRTLLSWLGHPHLKIVENKDTFEEKMADIIRKISQIVGVPEPLEIERKFLVDKKVHPASILRANAIEFTISDIRQTYLASPPEHAERVRAQRIGGGTIYTHTLKFNQVEGQSTEVEKTLSARDYFKMLERQDPSKQEIVKKRIVFIYRNQYFELDVFETPELPYYILELELTDLQQEIILPPFLDITEEVTGQVKFSNKALASRA